jgi:hypothetical protein
MAVSQKLRNQEIETPVHGREPRRSRSRLPGWLKPPMSMSIDRRRAGAPVRRRRRLRRRGECQWSGVACIPNVVSLMVLGKVVSKFSRPVKRLTLHSHQLFTYRVGE